MGIFIKKIKISDFGPETLHVYEAFSKKAGADYIASKIALEALMQVLGKLQPKRILEVGAGIGTMSYMALKYTDAHIDLFENNQFCIGELQKNLQGFEGRFTIVSDYKTFSLPSDSYDLCIVDGGTQELLRKIIQDAKNIKDIFIEGHRDEQRKVMRQCLRKRYTFQMLQYTDKDGKVAQFNDSQGIGKGAHEMVCVLNSNPLIRFLSYWFWEIRNGTEIKRSLAYRARRLFGMAKK